VVKMLMLFFNPEDGDSMFLQNVRIYLQVHTASQPRTTKSPPVPLLNNISVSQQPLNAYEEKVLCFQKYVNNL
jgi:hypothetical protein